MTLRTHAAYNSPLTFNEIALVVSSGRSSLNYYHPLLTLVTVLDLAPPPASNISPRKQNLSTTSRLDPASITFSSLFLSTTAPLLDCEHANLVALASWPFKPLHLAWTQHLQAGQRMEFLPTPFRHTLQGGGGGGTSQSCFVDYACASRSSLSSFHC